MFVRKEIAIIIAITFCIFAVLVGMAIYEWVREPNVPLAPRADALEMSSTRTPTTRRDPMKSSTSEEDGASESSGSFCETPECMHLADQLHNWKDPTIDPCTDFYQYACGRYLEHSDTDGNRNDEKRKVMKNLLHDFLVRNETSDSKSENTMRHVYQKCEELKRTKNFSQEIRDAYKDILSIGSWPMMKKKKWDDSKFDLGVGLSNLAKLSVLNFGFFEYEHLSNRNFIIKRPTMVFKKSEKREKITDWFKKTIKEICKVKNLKCDLKKIEKDFKSVWGFKKDIEAISSIKNSSVLFHWKDVESKLKVFNFPKIIEPLIQSEDIKKVKKRIVIPSENFEVFQKMEKIIQKTSPRILANFLALKYLEMASNFITVDKEHSERECVAVTIADLDEFQILRILDFQVVNKLLPHAALRVYVRNHYDKRNMEAVAEIINATHKSYIEMFNSSKYLSQQSKATMISKIQKMKIQLGYPKEFEAHGALDKTFDGLEIEESDTYYSIVRKVNVLISKWNMEFVAGSYPMDPIKPLNIPNANYLDDVNRLTILVAYMDAPKFHWSYPTYAKFANVGRVIAHETGHAFDKRGITFDDNLTRSDWMDSGDYKSFKKRMKCLEKQYDEYDDPVYGKKLSGKRVIMEIMADRLGQEIAFKTYKKSQTPNEQHMIGVKSQSFDQLFFNFLALDYCTTRSKETLKEALEAKHPVNTYRVNGMVKNLKQFAEAYKCPVGSPMNPKEKCELF